jgi:uncharacterized protein (DUF58 family)
MHCLVYPQPAAGRGAAPADGPRHDRRASGRQRQRGFLGLRGHQPADPPRHVAWKTAARQDAAAPLLTKQFSGASADILWLDWDATPDGLATETRRSILARWVLDAAASGVVWGFRLPAAVLPPACGDAHLHACLKALALHEDR